MFGDYTWVEKNAEGRQIEILGKDKSRFTVQILCKNCVGKVKPTVV